MLLKKGKLMSTPELEGELQKSLSEQIGSPEEIRLSKEAYNALVTAKSLPHHYIKPLHILIGLTQQSSFREVLADKGIVLANFEGILSFFLRTEGNPEVQHNQFSDRSIRAINIATEIVKKQNRNEILPMDIAQGIITVDEQKPQRLGVPKTASATLGELLKLLVH